MLSRRGLITGLISLAAAPAIVRASSLMPVKVIKLTPSYDNIFLRMIEEYRADLDKITGIDILYSKLQLRNDVFSIEPIKAEDFYIGDTRTISR